MLIGLLSGLLSGLLTRLVYACEDLFLKLPIHWMWWPMIGGLVVGLGGLIDPHALGVGYDNIAQMLHGGTLPAAALLLLVVKAIIWSMALGSGTSGGVLAPLLIMGGGSVRRSRPVLPAASAGFWPLLAMAAIDGRHHALAADRDVLRGRADRQHTCPAAAARPASPRIWSPCCCCGARS